MIVPGEISADGRSKWDGQKWVPIGTRMWTWLPTGFAQTPQALAIVSLVAAILSWVLLPGFGGLVAVLSGHAARRQIRQTGGPGAGIALAGLIIGYAHLVVVTIATILFMVVIEGLFFLLPGGVRR